MGAVKEDTQRVELTEEDAGVGGDGGLSAATHCQREQRCMCENRRTQDNRCTFETF